MTAPHRNRWVRIQGVALLMFVMSQIDRSNIALAFPSMRADLGLSATAIGFATGVFFWGYLLLQIPVRRLASVWSAKRTLMILGVGWALVSATTALVQTEIELVELLAKLRNVYRLTPHIAQKFADHAICCVISG